MELDRHQCTFPTMGFGFHDVQSVGRDTAVGKATRYLLDGPGIEIGRRRGFPRSPDRPWGSPTSCTMGTLSLS